MAEVVSPVRLGDGLIMHLLLLEPISGQNIVDNSPSIGKGLAYRVEVERSDFS